MQMRLLPGLVFFVTLGIPGCSNSTSPEVREVPSDAVAFVAADFDEALNALRYFSGYDERARLVIRDQATWARVWRRAAGTASSHSVPVVDFEQHMIIFAAMGTKPSGGYHIDIEGLYRRGADIYVVVAETMPRCGSATVETAPATAALVPRTIGRVRFVERVVGRCI